MKCCCFGQVNIPNLFEIKPDYDLNIMQANQDLFDVTSKAMLGLRDILKDAQPDVVLVHGDTTTCFAAALAAFYLNIPVGHVEAGLRTGDMKAPFPEEANRSLVGRIASFHFAPTETAKNNLLKENVSAVVRPASRSLWGSRCDRVSQGTGHDHLVHRRGRSGDG